MFYWKKSCFEKLTKMYDLEKDNKIITKFISILKKQIENRFVKYEKMFADKILFGGYLTPKLFIKLDLKTKKLARKFFNKINTSENTPNNNTFEETVIKEYDIYNELLESDGCEIVKKQKISSEWKTFEETISTFKSNHKNFWSIYRENFIEPYKFYKKICLIIVSNGSV